MWFLKSVKLQQTQKTASRNPETRYGFQLISICHFYNDLNFVPTLYPTRSTTKNFYTVGLISIQTFGKGVWTNARWQAVQLETHEP